MSSTICALATPPGAGGIAVVRVSGPEAYAVVGEIFTPRNPAKRVAEAKGYTAMLGHYHLRGEEMDETIALFFRAPHSYGRGQRWQSPLWTARWHGALRASRPLCKRWLPT